MSIQLRLFYISIIAIITIYLSACQKHINPNPVGGNSDTTDEDGTIYWKDGNDVNAFDVKSQKITWNTPIQFGNSSALAYDSGFVYTADQYGVTSLNAETGAIRWATPVSSKNFIHNYLSYLSAPVVVDSLLYFAGFTGNSGVICLYAVRKNNGSVKWLQTLTDVNDFASPVPCIAIAGNKIIATGWTGGHPWRMVCLDRIAGTIIWDKSYLVTLGNYPVVKDTMVYVSVLFPAGALGISLNTGKQVWKTALSNVSVEEQKPLLKKNSLVLIAYDNNTVNKPLFEYLDYNTGQVQTSTISKFNSYLETGNNYILSQADSISCFDQLTNSIKWQKRKNWAIIADTLSNKGLLDGVESGLVQDGENILFYGNFFNQVISGPGVSSEALNQFCFMNVSTGKVSVKIDLDRSIYMIGDLIYVRNGHACYPYKSPAYSSH